MGVKRLALTDINSTSACLDFVRLSAEYKVNPVLGIDFRNGAGPCYIGLAKDNDGYQQLNAWLSNFLHSPMKEIPARAPELEGAFFIYPFEVYSGFELRENEFVGVRPEQLIKLKRSPHRLPVSRVVALQTVSFETKAAYNAHRLLRAIDNNIILSKLPQSEQGSPQHRMLSPEVMRAAFSSAPTLVRNSEALLDRCQIAFSFGTDQPHKNQQTYTGSEREDFRLLRRLCDEGLDYRYGGNPSVVVRERMEKEFDIISKKGFLSYFLINWDITTYARNKGYFYVGRGSGANSILAYLLRITDVDPIELDLYFERFINLYRQNPPDFDIDFSWTDRDDVTRYMFDRFPHVSLLGAYVTFQRRAVVRELGKVFGLPKHEIDALSDGQLPRHKIDKMHRLVLRYGGLIQDFPSHCSVHSSGILISEQPIHSFSATFMPPKGFRTTQFDMVIAEDAGLYKFDILSQRGLGKIRDTIDIILRNHDTVVDAHDIRSFKEDPIINNLLKEGRAMGCFYVESPAMRMLLKKLQVDTYLGLVAASSIIRPGVSQSGMMREYIKRYRYPEKRKEAHPVMLDIMPDTFGVMVYQEDVIKVAHYFAGLSLGEADVLRRGMSGKFRSRDEFEKVRQQYFDNCREKGYPDELATEIWRQISSFAGYAFAKGHSASYAVESYQSLFLKAYYPLEYMVAVVNNGGGFYRPEFYLHEARMDGANIHAPCVNRSEVLCCLHGKELFIGLGFLRDMETRVAQLIVEERQENGPFQDFNDFIDRLHISLEQASVLIRINAFRFSGKDKRSLLWEAHFKLNQEKKAYRQDSLFRAGHKRFEIPVLETEEVEEAFDQIELLGFPLCHPFRLLAEQPGKFLRAEELPRYKGREVKMWGYLVTAKNTKTGKGQPMNFGTFLDVDGRFFDTTHFPDVAQRFPFRGRGVYEVCGSVEEEFGFFSIEVKSMCKIDMITDPRYSDQRLGDPGTFKVEKNLQNQRNPGLL